MFVEAKWKTLYCSAPNDEFGEILLCKLKIIDRYRNSVNINYRVKKEISQVTARLEFFKRGNGWRPFLYNISTDGCSFLNNRNNLIINIFYSYVKPYLAQNLTCPIKANEVLKLENFEFDINQFRNRFPIETGEYAVHTSLYSRKKLLVLMKTTLEYSNYREN
ncbi:uncharacterized protein LOC128254272 isoform X2 [Drosophila gunungcola]|uniref:uncharacterized protein LOC128254272 isoform X2 n=1 Tax=Drosophila gunungcola TaxID=103775 RepID=UPI0022DF8674|nr:uncharacterized protein LOC128254272 isoform X2 [Drosophila gunungcola]